jgi:TRAP-type C4-dicarboxylate transport system substrate-binding protein
MMGNTITALGGTSVSMPGPEVYMSVSTGVIDGTVTGPDYIMDMKLHEVAQYGLHLPIYTGIWIASMNKETWNSLPPNLQAVIDDVSREVFTADRAQAEANDKKAWEDIAKKTKMEVYSISAEERARWKKATAQIADKYLDEWSAKGYPVREAYQMMQKKVEMQK